MSSYIVEAYVQARVKDATSSRARLDSRGNSNQAVMTPRMLLSMLRLSQALARLRLSDTVSVEDVDEAIRLNYSSKASLIDEAGERGHQEDALSTIYAIIRDYATEQKQDTVNYATVQTMVIRRGFTNRQLEEAVKEYGGLGVLQVNENRTSIYVEGVNEY